MDGDINTWIVNHGEAQTTPPLLAVIHALKARGITQLAVTGYCFGGTLQLFLPPICLVLEPNSTTLL